MDLKQTIQQAIKGNTRDKRKTHDISARTSKIQCGVTHEISAKASART